MKQTGLVGLVWALVRIALIVVVLVQLRPVAAQDCVGDCRGESKVDITDLITGVNIALGSLPVSACQVFENAQGKVDVAQLIQGVNNALNGCPGAPTITLTGSCAAPGTGNHGLKPCDTGTPITVFRCDDRTQCLHQQGLTMVGATTVASGGGWSVQVPMSDASAALVFQASITKAVVYRTLGFGTVGGSLRAGLTRDVTFAPADITPVTEAAVKLLDSNGFASYSDTGAQEVLAAVEHATADLSFGDFTPAQAVAFALQRASADPTVMMVLQTARNTPTPTATPTPSDCGFDFTTCRGCARSGSAGFCVGDCNGDGSVTVDELFTACSIALGNAPRSACPAADPDGNGSISVSEFCDACLNAKNGCPIPPTATATATPTTPPTP